MYLINRIAKSIKKIAPKKIEAKKDPQLIWPTNQLFNSLVRLDDKLNIQLSSDKELKLLKILKRI